MFVFSNKQQRVHCCLSLWNSLSTCEYLRHDIYSLEYDHANGESWQWDQLIKKINQRLSWSGTGCQRYGGIFKVRKCFDVNSNRCAFIHQYQVIENLGDTETIGKDISRAKIRITMLAFEILFAIYSSIGPPMSQFQSNDFAIAEPAKSNEHQFANAIVFGLYKLDLTQVAVILLWLRKDIGNVVDESKARSIDENQTDSLAATINFFLSIKDFMFQKKIEACTDFFPKTRKYLLCEQQNNTHAKKKNYKKLAKLEKVCLVCLKYY
ncbi:hypothetical protein RFI_25010 [Reticulomyxa filosa]|uniref:Uncharacterized protein n=1 Tax=Reticulomyxa filosa TaxID=46433 RepID=X6MH62_RETFI|nr:hypothetical protein RFI_25010 [Reticulomyxa filosa]|eukprot:ETO12365.1 hypothetical protein RFI_25010 [Reticulomyxa filosa]